MTTQQTAPAATEIGAWTTLHLKSSRAHLMVQRPIGEVLEWIEQARPTFELHPLERGGNGDLQPFYVRPDEIAAVTTNV